MKGLKNKNVLITGGTSGIGQAIAVRFALEGAHVAINYRKLEKDAKETDAMVHEVLKKCIHDIKAHGVNHILTKADISKENEIEQMIREVISKFGGIDILINNAGIQKAADSHKMLTTDFDNVLAVNLRGAFIASKIVINHFLEKEKPGIIINISSVHQLIPKPQYLSYSISKGGMQNLTRTLALEYAGRDIRVNSVGPGATITPINRSWIDDPKKKEEVAKHIPMRRAGTAEEMAGVVVFIASEDAGYITGQTLFVDGGLTLYPDFRTAWSSD